MNPGPTDRTQADESWISAWLHNRLPEWMLDRWGRPKTLALAFVWGSLVGGLAIVWQSRFLAAIALFVSVVFAVFEPSRRSLWCAQLLGIAIPLILLGLLGTLRLS